MICVLKHKKSGKYVKACAGKVIQEPFIWDLGGNVLQAKLKWDNDTSKVQFQLTTDMLQARKIEDPNMGRVIAFGLEPIPIKIEKAVMKQDYRIIEHV